MTPDNTNHDTLQVYFDYLEDNNHDTTELRENLLENINHQLFFFIHVDFHNTVGNKGFPLVGSMGEIRLIRYEDEVGYSSTYRNTVSNQDHGTVGPYEVFNHVGNS